MAETVHGITLDISLDQSEFIKDLNEVKRQINLVTDSVNLYKSAVKRNPSNDTFADSLRESLLKLRKELQQDINDLEKLLKDTLAGGASTSDAKVIQLNKTIEVFSARLRNADKALLELNSTQAEVNEELEDYNPIVKEATDNTSVFGDVLKASLANDAIKFALRETIDAIKGIISAYTDAIKEGVEFNKEIEKYTVAITAMLDGNNERAVELVENMREIASKSVFDTSSLLKSSQLLLATGTSAEDAEKTIKALAEAIAYTGGGNDELQRMAQNLQQISNNGKAMEIDIRQFGNAGINVIGDLSDYLGKTTEQIKEMSSSKGGGITYEQITGALAKAAEEGGKYFGAINRQAETLSGQVYTIESNWKSLTGYLANDATGTLQTRLLPAINDTILAISEGLEADDMEAAKEAFSQGIADITTILVESMPTFLSSGMDIINAIADGLLTKEENGCTVLENAVSELVKALAEYVLNADFLKRLWDIGVSIAKGIFRGIAESLNNWINDYAYNKYHASASGMFSGGFGNLGAYRSGGYGNLQLQTTININNNGNLSSMDAQRFGKDIVDYVNNKLGRRL